MHLPGEECSQDRTITRRGNNALTRRGGKWRGGCALTKRGVEMRSCT